MPHSLTLTRLCQVRDLLREHLAQQVTLADCAEDVDLSPWHLHREFRAAFGETPHAYQTRLRIDRATRLLTVTGRSVTEVCFEVGFTSLGSFSTLFKRHTGWSPAAFRRRARGWVSVPAAAGWVFIPYCYLYPFGAPPTESKIREVSLDQTGYATSRSPSHLPD
jgi:AraC-like DNA-binding protein